MRRVAVVLDVAVVLLFVAVGRHAHTHGISVAGMATTSWPFLSGVVIGWFTATARRRDLGSVKGGTMVWISTVALGMALRVVSGQGTAVAFVLVALVFLGSTMLGWRAISERRFGVIRRRATQRRPTQRRAR